MHGEVSAGSKVMRLAKNGPELSNVHSNALLELGIDEALTLLAKPKPIPFMRLASYSLGCLTIKWQRWLMTSRQMV